MIEVTKPRAIALGYFDGVHLGHRALMQKAVERAKQIGGTSAVFTFDVHPDSVVMGRQVPLLTANAYRREEIKQLGGVDEVIFGHFDERMQHMDWRDFIHKLLIGQFHAGWIISGRNNRFGYKGQGNAEGMAVECAKAGIGYDCIEDVKVDGIVVSSTYIRQLIAQGDMEGAAKFLGHPYTVTGIVEHGRRVGTSVLGVPTVNLRLPAEMALPPYGVYATRVLVDGKSYIAATNIGVKPTFLDGGAPTIEPHLLDFSGDLYGRMIHVELHKFLRPEMQFESVEALKNELFPLADWITPNLPEAELLLGRKLKGEADYIDAARECHERWGAAVLLKSGHAPAGRFANDFICREGCVYRLSSKRLPDRGQSHGTGCTLSSALAAALALEMPWKSALCEAKAFVLGSLAEYVEIGPGVPAMYPLVDDRVEQVRLEKL